ncbi:MAG: DUF305 domain-containing protein [Gemmatimonadales bacterium]
MLRAPITVLAVFVAACSSATARAPDAAQNAPPYTSADVAFMTGMIQHHAQAILIAGWAPAHEANPAVRVLCERIIVAQRDEIALARNWLRQRGLPAPLGAPAPPPGDVDDDDAVAPHVGHDTLMPGMLTPEQLARLDAARGPAFDRLFLVLMIQHHRGALTMVEQLLDSPGGAQDGAIFRFAADVHADQSTEIERMSRMLFTLEGSSQ